MILLENGNRILGETVAAQLKAPSVPLQPLARDRQQSSVEVANEKQLHSDEQQRTCTSER